MFMMTNQAVYAVPKLETTASFFSVYLYLDNRVLWAGVEKALHKNLPVCISFF
jgi:hypothetical protein